MGRPSKLTDAAIQQVEELAALCLPLNTIASVLGVTYRSVHAWEARGEELVDDAEESLCDHDKRCVAFFHALNRGYGKAEKTIVQGLIDCLFDGQYGAGRFLLLAHPRFRKTWKEKDISLEDALKIVASALVAGNKDVIKTIQRVASQIVSSQTTEPNA